MRKPARRGPAIINYTVKGGAGRPANKSRALALEARPEQDVVLAERQELVGIQRDAFLAHLEVQVRPGRAAGGADARDDLALHHHVAHAHMAARKMGVARGEAVVVIDLD